MVQSLLPTCIIVEEIWWSTIFTQLWICYFYYQNFSAGCSINLYSIQKNMRPWSIKSLLLWIRELFCHSALSRAQSRNIRKKLILIMNLPEINSGFLLSMFVIFIAIEFPNFTSGVKWSNKWGIFQSRPFLNREPQRIFWKLLRSVGKRKISMKTQPGVVKSKSHKWEQEIYLLVNLRNGVSDVLLIVTDIITVSTLVKERIQFGFTNSFQSIGGNNPFCAPASRVLVSIRVGAGSLPIIPWIWRYNWINR